jgi:hypothetical protein
MSHIWTKNVFCEGNNRFTWCKIVSPLLYNNTFGYLCSQWTPNVQNKFFMFVWSIFTIFVLNLGWRRDSLQIMVFVYVCLTRNIDELKTRFEKWITRNDVNGVRLFQFLFNKTYGLSALTSDTKFPNQLHVQIKYFMCVLLIFTLFVLNRSWKRESLEKMIFVYVFSTWVVFKIKTRFETWITWNDVNGVRLIHLSYLITLMPYCSAPTVSIIFYFIFFHVTYFM